jgi:hypothetical protein
LTKINFLKGGFLKMIRQKKCMKKKTIFLSIFFILVGIVGQMNSLQLQAFTSTDKLTTIEARLQKLSYTSLPDFAPESFKSIKNKVRRLRSQFDKDGRIDRAALEYVQKQLDKFNKVTQRARKRIGEAYELRNQAMQINFIRAHNPQLFSVAEQNYSKLLKRVKQERFDYDQELAGTTIKQYKKLISGAHAQLQKEATSILAPYRAGITADMSTINARPLSFRKLNMMDNAYHRLRFGRPGIDFPGDDRFYYPPLPPKGPKAASSLTITKRTTNSFTMEWNDVSNDEVGNRVMRSTDQLTWTEVTDVGVIDKFEKFSFTDRDSNLTEGTRYCYRIETYNDEGTNQSQPACAYTLSGESIPIWRLQLRVKVADLPGAGLDHLMGIVFGRSVSYNFQTSHSIDYGHDDFKRSSDFTYDIDLGENMHELDDIVDFYMYVAGGEIYIEELSLLVNQREIFARNFGSTLQSVLKLGAGNAYSVSHAELRNHPAWQAFVNGYNNADNKGTFIIQPLITQQDGRPVLKIPREQVVSRIESIVGNMLHLSDQISSRVKWGKIHGDPVEVSKKGSKILSVDLDLELKLDNLPNPELDIDIDLEFSKSCNTDEDTLVISMKSINFKSNADSALWLDFASLGLSFVATKIFNFLANNSCDPILESERKFNFPTPDGFNCQEAVLTIDQDANIIISDESGS